jgi:hypothetical protein
MLQMNHTREQAFPDPASLVVVDEAGRLRLASLEQVRGLFDEERRTCSDWDAGHRKAANPLLKVLFRATGSCMSSGR